MNSSFPAILFSFLTPALILTLAFQSVARGAKLKASGWKWCSGLGLAAVGAMALPIKGLPVARWLAGYVDHWSIPLVALLVAALAQRFFEIELLSRDERKTAWIFGAVGGIALYPLALGFGSFDPFGLGWCFGPLFVAVGIITIVLQWRGNRFGVVLLIAMGAWCWRVPESANYWDCLMDPFYFFTSLIALCARGRSRPAANVTENLTA